MTPGVPTNSIRDAVYASLTAEFATVADGRPATVPLTPFFDRERDVVVVTASPAFAGKAARAAAEPHVSLLLHGEDDRLHLTGRATVRDADLAANAARVERLLRDEPPTPKRAAMTAAADRLDTRLGRLLLDWYGLRVLIEVDPHALDPASGTGAGRTVGTTDSTHGDGEIPADATTTVPAWPAADVDASEAATYDRAVATVVDEDGWPRSWPLAAPTVRDGRLRLAPPADLSPTAGQPACVLLHWHDDDLSALEQRLVRGRCRAGADGDVRFESASSFHLRNRTALDRLRFVLDGKRRTRAYFADRGESYRPWTGRALFGR
jgi:hypothetical protein